MKYMGSKARFVKNILPIITKNRQSNQWYIEPFAGGMNVIAETSGNRIANDINFYLIEMWKKLTNGWIPKRISKKEYVDIKVNKSKYPPYLIGWVGFNCSYSGKWFGGFAGNVNTKIGTVRDYQNEAIKNVLKQVKKMNGVVFENKSYNVLELKPNSIIYCDPPYKGVTKYINKFNHNNFWNWVRNISRSNVVFVSEYNAPSDFECIWEKEAKSSLSANGKVGGNKISIEKLFRLKK